MLKCVEGFIINETAYGETSKIINVFTKEYGLLGIIAKGAKSMKSTLRSSTIKFTYGFFQIYYKENKLSTLVSVDIINPLKNIKNDLILISYLTYITDLTNQILKETNNEKIFDLFIQAILKLDSNLDPLILTNILEVKYLQFIGVGINLDFCVICNNQKEIITIDATNGGLICKKCYRGQKIMNPKVLKLLRMYYLVDIKSISKIKIDDDIKTEINIFLNNYYDNYTGLYLKSKSFLKNIINI